MNNSIGHKSIICGVGLSWVGTWRSVVPQYVPLPRAPVGASLVGTWRSVVPQYVPLPRALVGASLVGSSKSGVHGDLEQPGDGGL